ncbi:type II toxin-antitoxin system VapB family antitoxin [Terracidiphilus sp.]|jgi:Arc/MetJ family transcription regulator|uniref:type II toxin-antitoxin system VapB family antitoxin n=1 Tax=Terracidiphilus sp. TaxID=1964191 RepID=UPI003C1308E9
MRTNIEIDDKLMRQAMKATGATTKKAAVEAALRQMVQIKNQGEIRKLFGKVVWRGHDDDWFATDGEILEKRRKETAASDSGEALSDSLTRRRRHTGTQSR